MPTPSIKTDGICLGCGGHLFTTQADIDARIAKVLKIEPGEDGKGRQSPPNTIRTECVSEVCPVPPRMAKPHKVVRIGADKVPGVVLPE